MSQKKRTFINPEELSNLKMVAGKESKVSVIIDVTLVKKQWVGIGWVEEGTPTLSDLNRYPIVRRTEIANLLKE